MARFGDQGFDQTKFENLLINFFITTDQPFQLVENPHFRDLLNYLQYTYPTMKPEHKVTLPKVLSWNSDDEGGMSDEEANLNGADAKSMKLPMRKRLREDVMKKGATVMCDLKKEVMEADTTINLALDAWTSENGFPFLCITELQGSHTGENMAEVVWKCIMDFRIASKVCLPLALYALMHWINNRLVALPQTMHLTTTR
ncbi:hypothetical protein BT69DRAFT_522575 [Atractiella rhizophila]|nr:hypothetical protein BT69DRAFT_522575 [Atractiella rhizophila]